tara:strand:- start:31112 stop:31426 length:315 start_codon:yes stop_codon:yes gene_type:complete
MALDNNEREEVNRLWGETNFHKAHLSKHETRISIVEDRMDRVSTMVAKIDDLSSDIRELNRSILTLELEAKHGKGALDSLLTKWIPALTAIGVLYLGLRGIMIP